MEEDHDDHSAAPQETHSPITVPEADGSLPLAGNQTIAFEKQPRSRAASTTGGTSQDSAFDTEAPASTKSSSRSCKDGPWCWQSKRALQQISEALGETEGAVRNARSVYLALCELASDAGDERVIVTKTLIGFRAGLSIRTVQRVLQDLERAAVVKIARNATGLRTASSYTLNSPKASTLSRNASTSGHAESCDLADIVKERKELKESIAPTGAAGATAVNPTLPDSIPEALQDHDPLLYSLASLGGSNPAQVPPKAMRGIAAALKQIKVVCPDVTPDEIQRRARHYRLHMPNAMLTAHALAKHWAHCEHPPQAPKPTTPPQRDYLAFETK